MQDWGDRHDGLTVASFPGDVTHSYVRGFPWSRVATAGPAPSIDAARKIGLRSRYRDACTFEGNDAS